IDFQAWVWAFNGFFYLCNEYIVWLSSHENWVFENISFDFGEVFILMLMIIILRFLILKYAPKYAIFILVLFLILELNRIYKAHHFSQKEEIIVFHQYKNSVLGIRNGTELDVFVADESESEKLYQYVIKPYVVNEGIQSVNHFKMADEVVSHYIKTKNLMVWNGKRILIVNQNLD